VSPSTIALFEKLLGMVQVKADDPDFEATVLTIITARKELAALKEEA